MKTTAEAMGAVPIFSLDRIRGGLLVGLRQTKFFLCLMISLSALFGYMLGAPEVTGTLGAAWLGTLLLTLGAASLNNIQDRDLDSHFSRTASRPLVSLELSLRHALLMTVALCSSGLILLGVIHGGIGNVLLGVASLVCYNCIYTPLKRRTTLALIPGAICGAMPVLIGFHAGAGTLVSPVGWMGFTTLVLWQFPHFFLLLLRFQDDYKQHAKGLITSHLDHFREPQMARNITMWSGALASVMWLYVATGIIRSPLFGSLAALTGAVLVGMVCRHLWLGWPRVGQTRLFIAFNQMFALFMALVVIDKILG